jgi:hypothetical protein
MVTSAKSKSFWLEDTLQGAKRNKQEQREALDFVIP